MIQDNIKPFYMFRHVDVSGNSGTGIVAIGAVFPSGEAVMQFLGTHHSITIYQNLEDVKAIHSHEGRTEIIMGEPPKKKTSRKK